MEIRYDHDSDAMYIKLVERPVHQSRRVTPNLNLDLDETGAVIGIEIISVRAAGIDPLTIAAVYVPTADNVERPDQNSIRQGRIARAEAARRKREQTTHDTP